jgi:putative FmdB family regulatory protein
MPAYEYTCLKCKKDFSVIMTLREYEQGKVKCPLCKGTEVEQKPASFFAVTSKKS